MGWREIRYAYRYVLKCEIVPLCYPLLQSHLQNLIRAFYMHWHAYVNVRLAALFILLPIDFSDSFHRWVGMHDSPNSL